MDVKTEVKLEVRQCASGVIRAGDLFGYVGIEAVLEQMRRKTMKAGFEFNIMVVGQSGLGKSTLVNTLFKSKVSRKSCTPNYEEKISKTVKLQSVSHVIEEKGVKMKLTVIDTPGFGDRINNDNCWEPIEKYVNEQYEGYLKEELHVNRKRRIPDTRVHCCIYFLPATGHWDSPHTLSHSVKSAAVKYSHKGSGGCRNSFVTFDDVKCHIDSNQEGAEQQKPSIRHI
ncbi:neuronal-specific septin-3-like [Diretmus argenteus]